jgi:fructosamine-3-kinase
VLPEAELCSALGSKVKAARPLGGGCINEAYCVQLEDGRAVFVKTHAREGLRWLAEPDAIRVPRVLAASEPGAARGFLALEYIQKGRRDANFSESLGRKLAALHKAGADGFGLLADNYLATLKQSNQPHEEWAAFYIEERLRPLVRLAFDRGLAPRRWAQDFEQLFGEMSNLAGPAEPPARLHGDLWSGNVHCSESNEPVLIDPAVYGGHREIDLAMLELFGSPGESFYDAYSEVYPLAAEREARIPLYQLYPLLAHVLLFPGGYVDSVDAALSKLL